jgi:hypothetical protein
MVLVVQVLIDELSKPLPAAVVTRFLQIRDTSSRNNQDCAERERGKVHTAVLWCASAD